MLSNQLVGGCHTAQVYRHPLINKISLFTRSLSDLPDPKAKRRVRWTPVNTAIAAILMAFDAASTLGQRCREGLACLDVDFTGKRRVGRTYNGLIKAMERQAETVPELLRHSLRASVLCAVEVLRRKDHWIVLAVDGSKEELPRTRSNEKEFGISDNGVVPQAFETVVVDVYTGLPWDWRIGDGKSSEKKHLAEMIPSLPPETLLLGDSNFGGYPLWNQLCQHGVSFLIRVGGNASLITGLFPETQIEKRRDIVYAWPKTKQGQCSPLRLRLIKVGSRNNPVYLITNVLDKALLTNEQAGTLYRKRWGSELFYRSFKRTMGYAKLGCRAGSRARLELEWGLIAATVAILIGIRTLIEKRRDPRRLSSAALLQALRSSLLSGDACKYSPDAARRLVSALSNALRDEYKRLNKKASRHIRITKNTPKPLILKPPRVRKATNAERKRAMQYAE